MQESEKAAEGWRSLELLYKRMQKFGKGRGFRRFALGLDLRTGPRRGGPKSGPLTGLITESGRRPSAVAS